MDCRKMLRRMEMGTSATAIILQSTFWWWGSQPSSTEHGLRIIPFWSNLCSFLLIPIQKASLLNWWSWGEGRRSVGGEGFTRGNRGWRVRISDFRSGVKFRVNFLRSPSPRVGLFQCLNLGQCYHQNCLAWRVRNFFMNIMGKDCPQNNSLFPFKITSYFSRMKTKSVYFRKGADTGEKSLLRMRRVKVLWETMVEL